MSLLVFVDDDESELKAMGTIATRGGYEYKGIHWPPGPNDPFTEFVKNPPDIFVLDLYLPPRDGSASEKISAEQCAIQSVMAGRVAKCFSGLYDQSFAGREKTLLQDTMKCLTNARALLDCQWSAMGQHPNNGIALLKDLKRRFPKVPVIFYSRKITPEDVVKVLHGGAADAIRKGFLSQDKLLRRLNRATKERRSIIDTKDTELLEM